MLIHTLMSIHTQSRGTIRQSINLISGLIRSSHGTLHTAIGEQSTDNNILDTTLTQEKVEVGRVEATEARFSLDNDIVGFGDEGGMKFGGPCTFLEGPSFFDAVEDSRVGVEFRGTLVLNWIVFEEVRRLLRIIESNNIVQS